MVSFNQCYSMPTQEQDAPQSKTSCTFGTLVVVVVGWLCGCSFFLNKFCLFFCFFFSHSLLLSFFFHLRNAVDRIGSHYSPSACALTVSSRVHRTYSSDTLYFTSSDFFFLFFPFSFDHTHNQQLDLTTGTLRFRQDNKLKSAWQKKLLTKIPLNLR